MTFGSILDWLISDRVLTVLLLGMGAIGLVGLVVALTRPPAP